MPILPENRKRYPKDWKQIRRKILDRANSMCEFCGVENYALHPKTGSKVVLTIAHLDHTPENCDPANLKALCQKCHNSYDIRHRIETRKNKIGQLPLFGLLLAVLMLAGCVGYVRVLKEAFEVK